MNPSILLENAREAGETETLRAACEIWARLLESLRTVQPNLVERVKTIQPLAVDDRVLRVCQQDGGRLKNSDVPSLSAELSRLMGRPMTVQFVDGGNQARDGPRRGDDDAGAAEGTRPDV